LLHVDLPESALDQVEFYAELRLENFRARLRVKPFSKVLTKMDLRLLGFCCPSPPKKSRRRAMRPVEDRDPKHARKRRVPKDSRAYERVAILTERLSLPVLGVRGILESMGGLTRHPSQKSNLDQECAL
jgi:hypothetical protein